MAKKNSGAEQPEAHQPETTVAETTVAETTVAETAVAETTVAETTVAETTAPETKEPETAQQATEQSDPVDKAHHLELLDLMDRFETDVIYENHVGEKFLSHNLAMLSVGHDKLKINTYHRQAIEPCAE